MIRLLKSSLADESEDFGSVVVCSSLKTLGLLVCSSLKTLGLLVCSSLKTLGLL